MILYKLMEVVEKVSDASLLLSVGFKLRYPELYEESIQSFGSWEATLARLVVFVRDKDQRDEHGIPTLEPDGSVEEIHRETHPDADHPSWGLTTTGEVIRLEPDDLPLSPQPHQVSWPESFGGLLRAENRGTLSDATVFTRQGYYYGVMKDLAPQTSNVENARTIHQSVEINDDDGIAALIPSHLLRQYDDRILHVTSMGKAKATLVKEYAQVVGRSGREAFLLNEGDTPIAVLVGDDLNGLFCASAMGQGIHMASQNIRSMGRKSVGVNVMKLSGEQDKVVSAFLTEDVREIAVITAQGYGKRMSFREFRKQGRGGAGMQVLRLNPNDFVVGVVPCSELSDLLLTTDTGKIWRVPASKFSVMGRAARGKRIWEIQDNETIIGLSCLPCAGNVARHETVDAEEENETPVENDAHGVNDIVGENDIVETHHESEVL